MRLPSVSWMPRMVGYANSQPFLYEPSRRIRYDFPASSVTAIQSWSNGRSMRPVVEPPTATVPVVSVPAAWSSPTSPTDTR